MGINKPSVIPTQEQIDAANSSTNTPEENIGYKKSDAEIEAEKEMLRRTEKQFLERERVLREQAERVAKAEIENNKPLTTSSSPVVTNQEIEELKIKPIQVDEINAPYDLIPLPSKGLIYPDKCPNIKISFLNASDENILTSPHLLESGEFLDILLRRKIVDKNIDPKDLHVGDRIAIMVWLRATAYGTNYPVQVINPNTGELIETEIDLSDIKTKELGAKPDSNGHFDFTFPISKKDCKFKLLTVRDIEAIDAQAKYELETLKKEYADSLTYSLQKQIVEIDGNKDPQYIANFISVLRVGDSRAIRKYINEIESGLDMNIEVKVPGGEPFTTFLPINFDFFWPNL